eukprot:8486077-Pyramimonas_sp.AAC.1
MYGTINRVRGVPDWARICHTNPPAGAFGGTPYGAKNRVKGVPNCVRVRQADSPAGAFGGAP